MATSAFRRFKALVSKNRNRLIEDGFDLDLTYVTDRIIAMGYPASRFEGIYRNHINEVYDFFECKHKDHYQIYNLCSERGYNISKFHNRVRTYPFDDHNPPCIEMIEPFCEDVDKWIRLHPRNVAAIHCKAGKGRTGTMICCYLLHIQYFNGSIEAIAHYADTRTKDGKGVTIPSQLRYIRYYDTLLQQRLKYIHTPVYVKEIYLTPPPTFSSGPNSVFYILSYQGLTNAEDYTSREQVRIHKSKPIQFKKTEPHIFFDVPCCNVLRGDLKIEVYRKMRFRRKKKLFQVWFNTFFVNTDPRVIRGENFDKTIVFKKNELDNLQKKDPNHKVYSNHFEVRVKLQMLPMNIPVLPRVPAAEGSESTDETSESSDDDEEHDWESGELKVDKNSDRESKSSGMKESKSGSSKSSDTKSKSDKSSNSPKAGCSKDFDPSKPGPSTSG